MYDAWKQERELLKNELANEMLNTLNVMSNISDRNYSENKILYMAFKMADSMLDRFADYKRNIFLNSYDC